MKNFAPKTVKIYNTEWMAENLAIDDGKGGIFVAKDGTHYYTLEAAQRIAKSLGWRIPSYQDMCDLNFASARKGGDRWSSAIKSTSGWTPDADGTSFNGTNELGLNIEPNGYVVARSTGTFDILGDGYEFVFYIGGNAHRQGVRETWIDIEDFVECTIDGIGNEFVEESFRVESDKLLTVRLVK